MRAPDQWLFAIASFIIRYLIGKPGGVPAHLSERPTIRPVERACNTRRFVLNESASRSKGARLFSLVWAATGRQDLSLICSGEVIDGLVKALECGSIHTTLDKQKPTVH